MNRSLFGITFIAATLGARLVLGADQPTQSEARHVPPDPPQHAMHVMSEEEMTELMGMDDTSAVGTVRFDQLEWRQVDGANALYWDAQGWYGNDYDKVWIKSEGERVKGEVEARNEVLWDHLFARWWNAQVGVRHDTGEGPSRTWAAFGVQGLAPYWFELEATAYVGEEGRTALRVSGEQELLLTQRLVLQPRLEFNVYAKNDVANRIGSGLSDSELGLRLRYEFRREFAPYIGFTWTRSYGNTAEFARAAGHDTNEVQWLAGVRWWF
jgi:copper resistance protein B